jgi:hypothetical protein
VEVQLSSSQVGLRYTRQQAGAMPQKEVEWPSLCEHCSTDYAETPCALLQVL